MELGRKNFRVNEVETLPNGELHLKTTPTKRTDPPIPREERPGTTLGPPMNDTTTLHKRLHTTQLLYRLAQFEVEKEIEMDKRKNRGELLPTPSFAPDTYILIRNADTASWIQLSNVTRGATVVQSLPSGRIEDLGGARVTTIETLYSFGRPAGGIDVVQMGKAFITAHHHIQTEDGWMTARQAADRGHGTLLTNHTYLKLYSVRLVGGGNIIIETSVTPDKAPTQIEAAMGYCFEPSTDPQQQGSLTYPTPQEASLREDRAAQDKPSYCCVVRRHLMGMSGRPTSQPTPLAPKSIAQLESDTATERANLTTANPIGDP